MKGRLIETVLAAAGYDATTDDDNLPGSDDAAAEAALADLQAILPAGWTARFTGSGNSSGDGITTEDVIVEPNE